MSKIGYRKALRIMSPIIVLFLYATVGVLLYEVAIRLGNIVSIPLLFISAAIQLSAIIVAIVMIIDLARGANNE